MAPLPINLTEASIEDLQCALVTRAITSVELVVLYLHRIAKYDCRGPVLNSICVLNAGVLQEAQDSDDYRASGLSPRPLEGIPFTVKDSFMVRGMTVAAGSPAFADLIAHEDAAIVSSLRAAGAVLLGKTNMPAMADGGHQRGLYGRAESPYNLKYATTAYASGSSNGCGSSTAASLAAFGFAGETVTSGRAPASNNALIGYSPSRGVIPNRGQWPLYPTCDVVVPHTRSMDDLFAILDSIVLDDSDAARGIDFWRNQDYVHIPKSSSIRPMNFMSLKCPTALSGKRAGIPKCFLGGSGTYVCSDSVQKLFYNAKALLISLGAEIVETDFPILEKYTHQDFPGQSCNVPGMSRDWVDIERCQMIAAGWDEFLINIGDPAYPGLAAVDPQKIHPLIAPMDDPSQHTEAQNQVRYLEMVEWAKTRPNGLHGFNDCQQALEALEAMRKAEFEDWMSSNQLDVIVFPTNGDVPNADADENFASMVHALQDGVKYSNGGRMMKHVGIPCITVPMGMIADKAMPVGVTFATKAHDDCNLLRYAYAFEARTKLRVSPPLTPPLVTDLIPPPRPSTGADVTLKPTLKIHTATWKVQDGPECLACDITITGAVEAPLSSVTIESVKIFADGELMRTLLVSAGVWAYEDRLFRPKVIERFPTLAHTPKHFFMVVIIATLSNGRTSASYMLVD